MEAETETQSVAGQAKAEGGEAISAAGQADAATPGASEASSATGEGGEQTPRTRTKPKYRKAFIIFGYTGTGYSGIQRNPGVRTLEDELFEALEKAKLIGPDDAKQARPKLDWTRSARTDKGVHAAANMIGAKLMEPAEGFGVAAERLNAFLPPNMRVYKVQRTVKSFSAQHAAGGRQYEYLLPTFVLKPVGVPDRAPAKPWVKAARRPGEPEPVVIPGKPTEDPFVTGAAQEAGRRQAWAASAAVGGRHSVFARLPPTTWDPAVVSAPAVELWAGDTPRGLDDGRDAPVKPPAAEASGTADPARGTKRPREEGGDEEEGGERSKASKGTDGDAHFKPEAVQVVHMTKGWTFDAAKYIYLAATVWKHRFQRKAVPLDYVPNAPRPGTAAFHHSHCMPIAPVTHVSAGPCLQREAVAAVAADPFCNGQAKAAGQAASWAARAAWEGKRREERTRDPWRLDGETLARLREAAGRLVGVHFFHNFTPRMTSGDAATQRTLYSINVSDAFMVGDMEYVRITLRGQSFILNQIRHMVSVMADFARGYLPPFLMDVIFSRNTRMSVPLAPATGLFLHNPEFPHFNKKHGETYGPIVFDEGTAIRDQVEAFKKEVVYPHMHAQMSGEDTNPFADFLAEYESRTFYRCSYADTSPYSTHASKTAMKEYVSRSFKDMADGMGKATAQATVNAIMGTSSRGARGHLFKAAQGAAQRSKRGRNRGHKRKRW